MVARRARDRLLQFVLRCHAVPRKRAEAEIAPKKMPDPAGLDDWNEVYAVPPAPTFPG
jgi:hypothetical protein